MSTDSTGSVAQILARLKSGSPEAFNELTRRYFPRIVAAAKRRLAERRVRAVDGDDIAASVFESLWARADEGRFAEQDLNEPDDLWRLLCRIMRSKTADAVRRERAQKRGGGQVRGDSVFVRRDEDHGGFDGLAGGDRTPDERVHFQERQAVLMAALPDDQVREIAILRLEGHSVEEIADIIRLSTRSVKRKLALIRAAWRHLDSGPTGVLRDQ